MGFFTGLQPGTKSNEILDSMDGVNDWVWENNETNPIEYGLDLAWDIMGWTWTKKEVIWSMVVAATDQGYCFLFQGNIPHCCRRNPTVIDFLHGAPYTQQIACCCKGGVLASQGHDSRVAVSA